MDKTKNLKLNKPVMTDFVSHSVEQVFGENFDIIDEKISDVDAAVSNLSVNLENKADEEHTHSDLAPKASPTFTGTPTAPTASKGTSTEQIATTAFVVSALEDINVTKEAVGLGNVPNVSTNDQTPTYDIASALTTLESGEKLSVSFGKIMLAITNLINHLADISNPHDVTLTQLGAAAASHKHSASDIISGTLSVTRGGTGVSNLTTTDYSTSRVRGISLQSTVPESISNGHIVGVYV